MEVWVQSHPESYAEWEEPIRQVLTRAFAKLGVDADVSVLLTDNVTIANLNHTYRGQDKPTDVLAFSQTEGTAFLDESSGLLGDIVISVEQARMQALEYGHGVAREIGFLAVHGLLHLLGYDHERPDDETRMMAQTEAILGAEGLTRS